MPANQPPANHPAMARLRELSKLTEIDPLMGFVRSPLEPYSDTLRKVAGAVDEAMAEWDVAVAGVGEATVQGAALARTLDTESDPDALALTLAKLEDAVRQGDAHAIVARGALKRAKAATSSYRAAARDAVRGDSAARDQYAREALKRLEGLHAAYRDAVGSVADLTSDIRTVLEGLALMAESSGDPALGSRITGLIQTLPGRLELARLGRGADATSPAVVNGVLSEGMVYLKAHGTVAPADQSAAMAVPAVPAGQYGAR